jgi:hypothetical protein
MYSMGRFTPARLDWALLCFWTVPHLHACYVLLVELQGADSEVNPAITFGLVQRNTSGLSVHSSCNCYMYNDAKAFAQGERYLTCLPDRSFEAQASNLSLYIDKPSVCRLVVSQIVPLCQCRLVHVASLVERVDPGH